MFTDWGLGDLLGTFPADNTIEHRVDGERDLIAQADWPPERVWSQLRERFWRPDLADGPITEIEIVRLRSQVFEPMSYGRLYLLGVRGLDVADVLQPLR